MKKLLSLLSVLTISGTTMPTLVANISYPYNNSDTRISFQDNHEEWGWGPSRGRIDFNVLSKKIEFGGFGYADNKFDTSVTIRITDENKNIVKTIFINKNKSLNDIIREYNLQNGIDYKNGYSIDIWSEKANSTIFHYKNNLNNRVWNLSTGPHTEKFIIMNDKLWEPNILIEKFPNLITRPLVRRTSNNNQNNYAPNLVIDEWDDNLSQYYDSLISVVDYLNREGIIEQFGRTNGTYRLTNQNGYFIIGIQFQGLSSLNNTVELVFDRSNLYLQGFILREDNGRQNSADGTYYYFSDSTYRTNLGINHLTNVNLNFGGSYTNLIADGDLNISSQSLFSSFRFLASFNNSNQQRINISSNLMRIILATSESLRFNNIISTIQRNNNPISWRSYFSNLLTNWGSMSQEFIRRVNNMNNGVQIWDHVNDNSSRISPALMAFLLNIRILNNK
ncbi:ribosome-inactivating family protein [Spiroplasma poulsonii]|uniref:Shiga toxin subunit A n=1 Tax=Spiroplasma poulsonii TaxID=2138 RepID=A0A2P6FG76_9MOLU|nr:ribosome-inactivating family protein [Spiroplasma poulsonii]KAF0849829.1 Shiga toxin subunit A precursor [Spiroplasma poulsonii]KAF0849973.1 Shiga toxin subunit A precursor [Spiroplasma poulsonii]PQM32467.1 Shiga toxin subunit A precursor [Spiroplasma poulsonii]PWF95133.1 Shiga toxin subunit A precursor [Spiroplasma poulsonii]PWF97926.1 Shiga toxin subunit A precursor [Spiroplasma poulsonii]